MQVKKWLAQVGLGVMVSGMLITPAGWAAAAHSDLVGCDGCHVPHNAGTLPGVPLWNGSQTTVTFTMYTSPTFQATIDNQPSGASRLCLSCHDGANPNFLWMSNSTKFGASELVKSHPISFVYDAALASADGALKNPSQPSTLGRTIAQDLLDAQSKMQCNSCHDVHTSGVGKALRGYSYGTESIVNPDGTKSQIHHGPELCRMCHLK
jgi:cytochrome c peroxidase